MIRVHNTTGVDILLNEKRFSIGESGLFSEKDAQDLIKLGCSYDVLEDEPKKKSKKDKPAKDKTEESAE